VTGFDPVAFLERAVRTPSHEDVTAMRDLLADELRDHGHEPTVDDAGNLLVTREAGDPAGPHVVLNTHIDTVSPHVPFEHVGDVLCGRGSCDAKGPLTALLAAFLGANPERGRLTLAVTPDEETLSLGAAALCFDDDSVLDEPDAVVVGEPTGLDVCNAAKGRFQATITLGGVNAHAAEPEKGVNAVRAAGPILTALESYDDRPDTPTPHPDLGPPTLTPTVVEGGEATNQIPASCRIVVDRRSVPPETDEAFRETLTAHLREHAPEDVTVDVALTERESPFLEAFETPADAPLVRTLQEAASGSVRPFTAATEASYFADAPTVVFGPGSLVDEEGPVAHADREYVRVSEVERAATALEQTLESLCS